MAIEQGIDVDYPIIKGNKGYFQQTFDSFETERNKLINLMSTNEGERMMQPSFGLGLQKYLFEQQTEIIADKIKQEVYNKITFWLPNLKINNMDIDVQTLAERNTIVITLDFSLKTNPSEFDVVTFTF